MSTCVWNKTVFLKAHAVLNFMNLICENAFKFYTSEELKRKYEWFQITSLCFVAHGRSVMNTIHNNKAHPSPMIKMQGMSPWRNSWF